jgi:ribonuclease P protein component
MTGADVGRGFRSEFRLRKTDEFSSVFAFRRALRGISLELLHRPAQGVSARLGVVVAKRFVRSAVGRNLVKRIVRESFRVARSRLPARDIVVRIRSRAQTIDRRALRAEMDALFARLAQ